MALHPQLVPIGFSMAAMLFWGTSDFTGGYAVRRANVFRFVTLTHATGTLLMLTLALAAHALIPSRDTVLWSLAGGALAGISLVLFYRALATGKMGLTTPVAAVLSAGIPTAYSMITQGSPGRLPLSGFLLAGAGIWLISRPEDGAPPKGLGMAVLAGIGFAGYFLCMKKAGDGSALWIAGLSRFCSLAVTGLILLFLRNLPRMTGRDIRFALFAGCIDISGSVFFIRATQTGRLDAVVVLSSLYPAVTVLLARIFLKEHVSHWKAVGMLAALAAVPLIALQ